MHGLKQPRPYLPESITAGAELLVNGPRGFRLSCAVVSIIGRGVKRYLREERDGIGGITARPSKRTQSCRGPLSKSARTGAPAI